MLTTWKRKRRQLTRKELESRHHMVLQCDNSDQLYSGLGSVDAFWQVWLQWATGDGLGSCVAIGEPADPPNFSVVYRTVLSGLC